MAKFSIAYVVFCEWLFALCFVGAAGPFLLYEHTLKSFAVAASFLLLAGISITGSVFLLKKFKRSRIYNNVFGCVVIVFSLWIFWLALHADPQGDGGEVGIFGIGFLFFAIPGLILLNFPKTVIHLSQRARC